jgi:hypothetical protein
MIKVFVHIAKAAVAIIAALLFTSCMGVNGSGNIVTEQRKITGHFTKISAKDGLEVYITQGGMASVSVETDDNLLRHIKTEVSGGVLKIYTDKSLHTSSKNVVSITLPTLEGVEASGGTSIKGNTVFKANTLVLDAGGGSNIDINTEAKKITLDASGGSSSTIKGSVASLNIDASGGSSVDAGGLIADTADVDGSGGASVTVNAVNKLTADASGGSSINYVKTPESLQKDVSSGGSVSQR